MFELEVDRSAFTVGAVLFQHDSEGHRRPVSYHSSLLTATERNYDIWDREFLSMIRGLKHNQHLLIGSPHKVVVRTDHENLAHYRHPQKINQRVAQYLHTLVDFDLKLKHIPGPTNKADGLSRRPDHDDGSEDNEQIIALPEALFVHAIQIGKLKRNIRNIQDKTNNQSWMNDHGCVKEDRTLFHDGALMVVNHKMKAKEILEHIMTALLQVIRAFEKPGKPSNETFGGQRCVNISQNMSKGVQFVRAKRQ